MRIILFTIVIGLLIFMTLMGFHKGFLKTIVSMSALILAFVFVHFFSTPITNFLDSKTTIRIGVEEKVYEQLKEKVQDNYAESAEEQKEAIKETFIPAALIESFDKNVDPMSVMNDYTKGLSNYTADVAVKAAGLVASFLIAFIVIKVIVILTKIVSKVPLIGGLNKILGGVFGFARALIIIWLIFFVITAIADTSIGQQALAVIKESQVLSLFYDGALSFGGLFF